jgi:hypothetical protein
MSRELRRAAEDEAVRMWPADLHLGRWDGSLSRQEVERRLLIQRQAFVMGAEWAAHRAATEPGGSQP